MPERERLDGTRERCCPGRRRSSLRLRLRLRSCKKEEDEEGKKKAAEKAKEGKGKAAEGNLSLVSAETSLLVII